MVEGLRALPVVEALVESGVAIVLGMRAENFPNRSLACIHADIGMDGEISVEIVGKNTAAPEELHASDPFLLQAWALAALLEAYDTY